MFPVLSADSLTGTEIKNHRGEDLGKLEDVMIDTAGGKIEYGVVSFGGFMGMGDKLFAVPWSALTVDTDEKCIRFPRERKELENAPGFDKDDWPNFADPKWSQSISEYYGVTI